MSAPAKARKASPKKPAPPPEPVGPDLEDDVDSDAEGDEDGQEETEEPKPVGPVRVGARPPVLIDVFELDGVMYRAPAEPSAALVIEYLRQVRRAQKLKGDARAMATADAVETYVVAILGEEAWRTLGESPAVTVSDVTAVVLKVGSEIAFPAVQKFLEASGNS